MLQKACVIGASLALVTLALGGCTSFKQALGLEKVVPDEFAVTTPAPLALPPDYSLRPPRPGAARPQETSPTDQARQTVFRIGAPKEALPAPAASRSPGEGALLTAAGAGNAPADIRQLVNADADRSGDYSNSFVDKLLFWRAEANAKDSPNKVINPGQEAMRLRENKEVGAAPDSAPPKSLAGTPIIERTQKSSWFSWLF